MTFGYFIRNLLEVFQFVLISSTNEIYLHKTLNTNRSISLTFAILMIFAMFLFLFLFEFNFLSFHLIE